MKLETTHDGGALQGPSTWRLKDLLPADELCGPGRLIAAGELLDDSVVRLELTDGTEHLVPRPDASPERSAAADLLFRNLGQVLTMVADEHPLVADGHPLGLASGAVVACRGAEILGVFPENTPPPLAVGARVVDGRGGLLTPGLVDPHTHPVFAGERSVEFGMKAEGRPYLEIHKAGGGIFSTVRATREASKQELAARCGANLDRLLRWGVTSCEGKSGYALELDGELRMLEALRIVADSHPVDVTPTLLGAHAVPPEHKDSRGDYIDQIIERMIPQAAARDLARYCDAYCEDGAFNADEVRRIFTAAKQAGLGLRLHAEQFTHQGGAELAAELGAASADHLEAVSPAAIELMARAGTVAVMLPGAALTCRCPWPPARDIIDGGVALAIGTDLNPGTSFTASLPLMMSLACMQMGVSCEEAWLGVTRNAARSLHRDDIGVITPGARADLVLFDVPDYRTVPYHYGENHARQVFKSGRLVVSRDNGARSQGSQR